MRLSPRRSSFTFLWLAGVILIARPAFAQEQPRRPLLESLLRGVLDEQLRRADRDRDRDRDQARSPRLENLNAIGAAFREFEQDVNRLADALSQAARQSSAASRLHNQALQLRTAASRAASLSQSANNESAIRALASTIDREWRNLEFGLKETFVANRSLQGHIDQINRAEDKISRLFDLTPQFSRTDAVRELEVFSETISHIVEDLEFQLRFSEDRTDLTLSTWRIRQLAKYIIVLMDEASSSNHDEIVAEFRTLDQRWRVLAIRLRSYGDRHLDRDVRRAEESLNKVRRLLRLPQQLDRAEIDQLADNLKRSTEGLFKSITLETLVSIPSTQTLLPDAKQFSDHCDQFQRTLSEDFRRVNLVNRFRAVESSWRDLSRRLSVARDRETLEAMEDVERSVNTLRLLLGAPEDNNRYEVQEATSSLTVLTRHLETEIAKRVSSSPQYSSSFRRSLQQEISQITLASVRLNENAVRGINRTQLNSEVRSLAERWARTQMMLAKLQPRDRGVVTLISSQVSEQLLKLGAGN